MGKSKQNRRRAERKQQRKEAQLRTMTWQTEIIRVNKNWEVYKQQEDKEAQEIKQRIIQRTEKLSNMKQKIETKTRRERSLQEAVQVLEKAL